MNNETQMTAEQARETLSRGDLVRMVVGESPDDPTLILYLQDGMVISEAIAGWSAGVVEQVCALESDFLATFLLDRHSVEPLSAQRT
jgi:hypothetical protein